MIQKSYSDLQVAVINAIEAIRINRDAYLGNKKAGWLGIDTQLFVLLCDPNPKRSLLGKFIPDICFYPLYEQIERPNKKDDVVFLDASCFKTHLDNGTITIELFNTNKPKLPMKNWLKQIIGVHSYNEIGHYVSIEQLIRKSRNQLGPGHFDDSPEPITASLEYPIINNGGVTYPFYEWAIVLISNIVEDEVRQRINC